MFKCKCVIKWFHFRRDSIPWNFCLFRSGTKSFGNGVIEIRKGLEKSGNFEINGYDRLQNIYSQLSLSRLRLSGITA